jgi:UDP-glucuronate 4-epimerase
VLVTGGAGFVGSHAAEALLRRGTDVVVLDAHTNWPYPERWKAANLRLLHACAAQPGHGSLTALEGDCSSRADVARAFAAAPVTGVLHLAALSGVVGGRPEDTVASNVGGVCVVLEAARQAAATRVVLASSGAVYGDRGEALGAVGVCETHAADAPLSIYAASKRAAELVAHALSVGGGTPTTVLRLFTVYGPRCRADMAPFRFVRDVTAGVPLSLHGDGSSWRDYVFVGDVVRALLNALDAPPAEAFAIVNVAGGRAVRLRDFVAAVERATGCVAAVRRVPGRAGDVGGTFADISKATARGWTPTVSLDDGLRQTAAWWRSSDADAYREDTSAAPPGS